MSLRRVASFFRGARPARRRTARGPRPLLERLEDRLTPTTVMNLNDSGAGSLRQAILDTPAGGTVNFQSGLSGTITLTSGELAVSKDLTIAGPGPAALTVSGNNASRVFDVAAAVHVAVTGLTVAGGSASDFGAGILNAGTLALDNVVIHGNTVTGKTGNIFNATGGGIYNTGTLTVTDSTLSGNAANGVGTAGIIGGAGGAIFNSGTLTIATSTLSNNSASGSSPDTGEGNGGGVYNSQTLTVKDSTFEGNVAGSGAANEAGFGGAIENTGTAVITGSTLSDNSSISGGGGIYNYKTLSITNSTLTGNSSSGAGGIQNILGTLTVTGCTLSKNTASGPTAGYGGAIGNGEGVVNVSGSTFSGNSASGASNYGAGGAIYNSAGSQAATLSVSNSTFTGNSASGVTAGGGAIDNDQSRATTTVTGCTLSGNSVSSSRGAASGGGIENIFGTLTVTGSTLRGNTAVYGGGIDNGGTVTVSDSTFDGNQASSGGGLSTNGSATVSRCTFSNNSSGYGGGLSGDGGSVTVTNSTFTGNTALSGSGEGGAILAPGLTLLDSTLSGNSANSGGGLFAASANVVRNTIIAGNTAPSSPDVASGITSRGHNLIGNDTGGSGFGGTDLVGGPTNPIDPKLGPLRDNGGPTQTMALLPGSPALSAGDPAELGKTDQRGVTRAGAVSIGAYQASAGLFLVAPAAAQAGVPFDVTVTARDAYGNLATGYRGTVHFTSTDAQATLPADYPFTAGDGGTHTFSNGVTLKTAGAQGVTVSDGTLQNTANTTVVSNPATRLVVTAQPPGMVGPGAPFGLTVAAEDANGVVDTSYGGSVSLALASNPGGATLGGTTSMNAVNGVATFSGLTLDKVGIGYTVQATSSGLSSATTNAFDVDALALSGGSVLEFRPVGTAAGTLSTTPGTGHTFTYTLVSGAGSADNASFQVSGSQLVTADAFDAGAKSSYSVRVRSTDERGLSVEQPFTITVTDDPALALSGGTLVVSGTAGNDAFSFTPGTPQDAMALDGTALAVDAASVPGGVAFSGNGGSDSATLTAAGPGPSTLNASPAGGTLSGAGYKVSASGVAQLVANGRPGDRAYPVGSSGPDAFVGTPAYAYLRGGGYLDLANGFGVVLAVGGGGSDTAYLYGDPAGGNVFVATPGYAYLRGGTSAFFNQANGFQTAIGTAASSSDQAYVYGSGGNVFVTAPGYAYLYGGSGPWEQANGFKYLIAVAPGSGNTAYLYGGPAAGGNVLVVAPSYAYLSGGGALAYAAGFQTVVGAAGSAADSAYLYGAPGATFVATSSSASMTGGGATAQASGFGSVYAYSGGGGQAYLYGTMTSADTFVDGGGYAVLFGAGFFDYAGGFASVWANPYAHR